MTGNAYRTDALFYVDEALEVLSAYLKELPSVFSIRPDTVRLDLDWLLEVRLELMLERDYTGE